MLSSSPFLFLVTTSTHLFMRLLTCSSPWIPSTSKPVTPCLPPQCTRHAPLSWTGWVQGRSWAGLWSCRILAVPASTWPGTSSSVTPVKITRGTEKPTRSNHVTFPSKPRAEIPVPFLYLNLCNYTLHIKLHITHHM